MPRTYIYTPLHELVFYFISIFFPSLGESLAPDRSVRYILLPASQSRLGFLSFGKGGGGGGGCRKYLEERAIWLVG